LSERHEFSVANETETSEHPRIGSDAPAPADLQVTPLGGSGEYAVLSFSLSPLKLPKSFSRAEREVAAAIAIGCSNAAIARQRGTSIRTVENQIYGLFRKLGIGSRIELAAYLGGLPRQ
jgi:DNA-binding NarL/FixJ family response regulator